MILKNWLSNTRIGFFLLSGAWMTSSLLKRTCLMTMRMSLRKFLFLGLDYHFFVFIFLKATHNIVLKFM
jgi:hypothetical protein